MPDDDHILSSGSQCAEGRLKQLGRQYRAQKQYEEAVRTFQELIERDRGDPDAWFELGASLVDLRRHDEAVAAFREAVAIDPRRSILWDYLGYLYKVQNKAKDAMECFGRSVALNAKGDYAWRMLADCLGKAGYIERQIAALEEVTACCPTDHAAWSSLGIAYWNKSDLPHAVEAYSEAAKHNLTDPSPLFNLGLAHAKAGHLLDAAYAYRSAIAREPGHAKATEQLRALEPYLAELRKHIEANEATRTSEAYDIYLNPLEILAYSPGSPDEWDEAEVRKAKKRVLRELDLNDGRLHWLNNVALDRSRVLQVLDDLDSMEKREFHYHVRRDTRFLRFLTHGSLMYFAYDSRAESPLLPWGMEDDGDFLEFIGPYFARQYDRQLTEYLTANQNVLINALSSRRLPVPADLQEDCYRTAHTQLRQCLDDIRRRSGSIADSPNAAVQLTSFLTKRIIAATLNALPPYFENLRGDIANAIRSAAVDCYNKHDNAELSRAILALARALKVPDHISTQLKDDEAQISDIIHREQEARLDIVMGSTPLHIDHQKIVFGNKSVPIAQLSGARWGVFREYTNGIRTSCSYLVSFWGQACGQVDIECHRHRFLSFGQDEVESAARFDKVMKSCFTNVIPAVVQNAVARIEEGHPLQAGRYQFTKTGVVLTAGVLWWKTTRQYAWHDLRFAAHEGKVILQVESNDRVRVALSMREDWNAVLLEFIAAAMVNGNKG